VTLKSWLEVSRSFKMVPFESLGGVSYSPSIYNNYGSVLQQLRDKARYWPKIVIFTARRVCIAQFTTWQDACPSVRPSVCPPVLCLNGYTYSQSFFTIGSITILVFHNQRDGNIPTGTPITGASNARGGGVKNTMFDQHRALSQN